MPRSVAEWIGHTLDTPVPPRVRLRVLRRYDHACGNCGRHIHTGDKWQCDHTEALILGGDNRESNLRPLCAWCHGLKSKFDAQAKSIIARRAKRHYGIRGKLKSRPLIGTVASGWRKHFDGGWSRRAGEG